MKELVDYRMGGAQWLISGILSIMKQRDGAREIERPPKPRVTENSVQIVHACMACT